MPSRAEKDKLRTDAFSDGVFAIAITLLAIELPIATIESSDLLGEMADHWAEYAAFLSSFLIILVVWINHHNLMSHFSRVNKPFMLFNGLLLLAVTVIPFATRLLAEHLGHEGGRAAAAVYAGVGVYLAFTFNLLWRYATFHRRLVAPHVTQGEIRSVNRQYAFGPAAYGAAFLLAFWNDYASFALMAGNAIFYAVTATIGADDGAAPSESPV